MAKKFNRLWALLAILLFSVSAMAQEMKVSGTLEDRDTKEGVIMATVQLLRSDSTFIKGVLTDDNGAFSIDIDQPGKYIVRFSSVGYKTKATSFSVSANKPEANLGRVKFGADAIMLKGATVTGQAAKVTLKEDTFVYNASAYRTPEVPLSRNW